MRRECGSALVLALFILTVLTAMGTALLFLSQQETRMGQASLRSKRVFYLAEAGVEDGRMTLLDANTDDQLDNDLDLAAGANNTIDFDPAALSVVYDTAGNVSGINGYGDDVPIRDLTVLGLAADRGWYAAFLTNDPAEPGSTPRKEQTDTNGRVMITGIGAGATGSLEIAEAIVEPYRYLPDPPAAALTLLGPLPTYDSGTDSSQSHVGGDCGTTGGAFAPIIGTIGSSARDKVRTEIGPGTYSSGSYTGTDTVADLTVASGIVAAAGHGTIDPTWTDCANLKDVVEELAAEADYFCDTDSSTCAIPTTAGPDEIVFIDGDLTSTPSGSFSGVLVVTGDLTFDAHTAWDGMVLALGTGSVLRNGSGSGGPSGGMVVAAMDPSPTGTRADKSDWCSSGFTQASYQTAGSGDPEVEWCSARLDAANSTRSFRVVEFAQR